MLTVKVMLKHLSEMFFSKQILKFDVCHITKDSRQLHHLLLIKGCSKARIELPCVLPTNREVALALLRPNYHGLCGMKTHVP